MTNGHVPVELIHDQAHPLNIIGVIKSTDWEFENYLKYASLCRHLIADRIVDRIEVINPHYCLYVRTSQQKYFWQTHSNDKISEVISLFASVQSNSVALEGSCQYMVYRSMIKQRGNWKSLYIKTLQITSFSDTFTQFVHPIIPLK